MENVVMFITDWETSRQLKRAGAMAELMFELMY